MKKIKPYVKFVAALCAAGLIAAQQVLPMSPAAHGWVAIGLAVVGAAAVYKFENAPLPGKRRRTDS